MPVLSQPVTRGTSVRLSDAVHVLGALAAGLLPLMVFAVLSYHQTMRRAEADLTETVEVARQFVQDLLQQAELELTRFVQVTDGRVSPESKKLLREIVYTNPYFREAGIIDEQGFPGSFHRRRNRNADRDPSGSALGSQRQIDADRRSRANLDHAREIDRPAAFDTGPGRGQCSGRPRSADPPLPRCRAWPRGELASRRSRREGVERAQPPHERSTMRLRWRRPPI